MIAKLKTKPLTFWGLPALVTLLTTTVAIAQQLELEPESSTQAEESSVILESTEQESPVAKPRSIPKQKVSVHDIPIPRNQSPPSWVVDLTGSVSPEAIDYIDRVCDEVNAATKREMCVVVVNGIQGNDHRQFAKQLFNHWGVGNKKSVPFFSGDWSDNGILLFFAMNERKVELILGVGIDSPKQQKVAQKIIDDHVIPNMNDDSDSAMYQAIRACGTQLVGVGDIEAPVMLPSVAGELPQPRGPRRQQRGPVTWWPWLAGGGLLGGFCLLYTSPSPRDS